MLTGRTVFTGDPMAVMIHHARTPPVPPSKIAGPLPAGLDEIVLACLDKAPEKRPASAIELWRRLGAVALTTPWSSERAERWWREHLPEFARSSRSVDSSAEIRLPPGPCRMASCGLATFNVLNEGGGARGRSRPLSPVAAAVARRRLRPAGSPA